MWMLQYADMNSSLISSSGVGSAAHLMCSYCNYTSPKRYLLARHLKAHSEERPHKCNICSRMFKTIPALQNHVNTHTGVRPQHCKVVSIDGRKTRFELRSVSHSRDIEGAPKFKSRSRDLAMPFFYPKCTICVKFNLFDVLVKFCDDSFIGHQERCWNALHWLKLEVLPKEQFWRYKRGGPSIDPWNLSIKLSVCYHMSYPCTKFEPMDSISAYFLAV